jgi:hypothetical protein
MLINALYSALVITNVVVVVAMCFFPSRFRTVTVLVMLLNAVALVFFLIPLVTLLFDPRAPAESGIAIKILLPRTCLLVAEFACLLLLFRKNADRPNVNDHRP